jgi:hypothetical protein
MSFKSTLSSIWYNIQYTLFPVLCEEINLSDKYKELVSILEMIRIEQFISPHVLFTKGRPPKDKVFIARAFIAKIVLKLPYTNQIIDLLERDTELRCICGWEISSKIPHKSKFSRAFKDFSLASLPEKVHDSLIKKVYSNEILGHIGYDSTALIGREKHLKKEGTRKERKKLANQRYEKEKKGELQSRRQKQMTQSLNEMVGELPKMCDFGMKKNSHGTATVWKGFKFHVAVDDMGIPISAILTSASLNDCEVAIPLMTKTKSLVENFYDLMDSAYDVDEIKEFSRSLGHVPIIDVNSRGTVQKNENEIEAKRKNILKAYTAEDIRYKQRFPKERFNSLFKEYYGGRNIQYKGHAKVFCHAMFGVLAYTAITFLRFNY